MDHNSEKQRSGRGNHSRDRLEHNESKSYGRGRGNGARGSGGRGGQRGRSSHGNLSSYNNQQDEDENGPQHKKSTMQISHHVKNYLEGDDYTPSACERFLQGLIDDRYDASYQLILVTKDENNLQKFQRCFFNLESKTHFYRLLKFFSDQKLSYGSSKISVTQCCTSIYTSNYLRRLNMTNEDFQEDRIILLAWFLLKIMATIPEARSDRCVLDLAGQLEVYNPDLRNFLSSSRNGSMENITLFQKQHDNDFPFDFRLVEIIPTAKELSSNSDMVNLISERLKILYPVPSVSGIIDYQFRFLRENWVQTLKEEYYSERSKPDFSDSRRIYGLPRLLQFATSKYGDKFFAEILLTPNPSILSLLSQQENLKEFLFSKAGSRILPIGSSVFLLNAAKDVVAIGTIASRDVDEAFLDNLKRNKLVKIGLTFPSQVWRQILNIAKHEDFGQQPDEVFPLCQYLYSSSVISFVSPILSHLKNMTTIPFQEEIVQRQESLALAQPLNFSKLQSEINDDTDRSQINALQKTCENRFSLIQGPPGTGKTYIGVQLAKFLLNADYSHKVLTLSYTNHALDSFMESILDSTNGTFDDCIKRLGRSLKTSTRMKQHAIGNAKFSYNQLMCSRELKEQLDIQIKELKNILSDLQKSRFWTAKSWGFVKYYLSKYGDANIIEEFVLPKGVSIAGRKGKALKDQDIFRSWYHGDPCPDFIEVGSNESVWRLSKLARQNLLNQWNDDYFQILLTDFQNLHQTTQRIVTNLSELSNEPKLQELAQARLLGATTSSACQSSDLIARFSPTVLIIEEAAEILEAHILVNIPRSVKHIILIGDHKQLRPKVDLYSLQKVSNRGIDFDVSLFERLASNPNFQLATLGVQHRMRPEFSEIIRRSTYPELQDHSSTVGRANILGLQSNLIFIDHHHLEKSHADVLEKVAKVNEFEANMVVETVIYLLQQGYATDDIVVLTPYLGQLFRLHELFSKCQLKARVSKMDADDLNTSGFDDIESDTLSETPIPSSTTSTLREVRVATVDNFQGEESKIIICSLVRCNDDGNIGFLYEPERLNVLCSRARDGFILYGSLTTVLKSKGSQTWAPFIKYLRETGSIFSGLPIKCQRHQTLNLISAPEEFKIKSPDGGCCQPCEEIIVTCTATVKHTCWRKCHADASSHRSLCRAQVQLLCVNGHPLSRTCCSSEIPVCTVMMNVPCARGVHQVKKKCGASNLPKCFKNFKTMCPNSHSITVCCSMEDSQFSANCSICKKAEEMLHDPALEAELKLKQLELEDIQLQAAKSEIDFNHNQRLKEISSQMEASRKQIEMYNDPYWNSTYSQPQIPVNDTVKQLSEQKIHEISRQKSKVKPISVHVDLPVPRSVEKDITQIPEFPAAGSAKVPDKVDPFTPPVHHSEKFSSKRSDLAGSEKVSDKVDPFTPPVHHSENFSSKRSDLAGSEEVSDKVDPFTPPVHRSENFSSKRSDLVGSEKVSDKVDPFTPPVHHSENLSIKGSDAQIAQILDLVGLATGNDKWVELYQKCENYHAVSRLEREAVEGLKLLAEWKSEFNTDPYRNYDYHVMDDQVTSESDHLCHAIIKYLQFLFNKVNPDIKQESLLLYGWECRAMQSLQYEALDPWKTEIATFLQSVKKEGLKSVTNNNPQSANPRSRQETALNKWNQCIKSYRESNARKEDAKSSPSPAVDSLMKMIGLESVKNEFVTLYNHIMISNQRGSGHSNSYNIRFEGNPGTGKTTVARHYANFLKEVDILPSECEFYETSGSKLIIDGPGGLQKKLEEMKENGGCVVFVDEAYQLEPSTNQQGAQVLNYIIPLAERLEGEFGKVVWIFAGYVNDMEKLFNFNQGLSSRFPTRFVFEDYSNDELEMIFRQYLRNDPPEPPQKKKKKETKPPDNVKNSSSNMVASDQWGNTWTFDATYYRWTDEYGNINAYGPQSASRSSRNSYQAIYGLNSYVLGSTDSPIINQKTGINWAFDETRGKWYNVHDRNQTSDSYPGKPVVPKRSKMVAIPFHVDNDKWIRIAIRRVASRRMIKGFGNARDVRLLFDKCIQRQSDRISRFRRDNPHKKIDLHLLIRDDILGPKASQSLLDNCLEYRQLLQMEGLSAMKEEIRQILTMVIANSEREDREEPLLNLSLNRVFYGNPGTGKTTVARLYGKILCALGILSKGDTILKNPSDFIGSVIGGSESSTRAILSAAEGCVLVIDEAYMLNPSRSTGLSSGGGDPYKTAVLDTLVEQVQGVPGDDRVVLLLGYKKEMEEMFRNCNPGLSRRFQFDNPIIFEDYSDESLLRILRSKVMECGLSIDMKTALFAIKQLSKKRSLPNFGNAGEINNMLNDAKKYVIRRGEKILRQEDFCKGGQLPTSLDNMQVMNDLIGNEEIDELIEDYKNLVKFADTQGTNVKDIIDYNFLFVGSPGTGKTTVARKMGEIFHQLGLLPSADVVDISAKDLVTGYVGQSGKKTAEFLHNSRGKVLFIDEAYQLNPAKGGQYMQEVVDEIVRALTSEEIKGNMVLILAGYERDIEEMLTVNQGLRSRISKKIHFPDFDCNKICQMLISSLGKKSFGLSNDALRVLPQGADDLRISPGFSNGRDIETLSRRIMTNALRAKNLPGQVSADVLQNSFNELISELHRSAKMSSMNPTATLNQGSSPQNMMQAFANQLPPPRSMSTTQKAEVKSSEIINSPPPDVPENIDDSFLRTMQQFLDERGLNSKEGVERLVNLNEDELDDIAHELASRLQIDVDTVKSMLREWQRDQRKTLIKIEEAERELAQMKKTKKRGLVPIWRCGACGRADQPYIVCYVRPFVVRYEERDLKD